MFSPSVTVPQAIKEILSSNNLYLQALLAGIANYTALAQKIKLDVEKLTNSEVNIGTIVVAIKRLIDRLQEEEEIQNKSDLKHVLPIIEGARMSLTGSVIDIDFNKSRFDQLSDIFDELFEKEISHKYSLFQTEKQIRLLNGGSGGAGGAGGEGGQGGKNVAEDSGKNMGVCCKDPGNTKIDQKANGGDSNGGHGGNANGGDARA